VVEQGPVGGDPADVQEVVVWQHDVPAGDDQAAVERVEGRGVAVGVLDGAAARLEVLGPRLAAVGVVGDDGVVDGAVAGRVDEVGRADDVDLAGVRVDHHVVDSAAGGATAAGVPGGVVVDGDPVAVEGGVEIARGGFGGQGDDAEPEQEGGCGQPGGGAAAGGTGPGAAGPGWEVAGPHGFPQGDRI
jgi:hypothetical protein